jgi:hypothetical protein
LSLLYYGTRTEQPHRIVLLSAAIFVFDPSKLYMQTTPMIELPFMALLVIMFMCSKNGP